MNQSRRRFFKQGLCSTLSLGALASAGTVLGTSCTERSVRAKRVVIFTLDGICVEGFRKARTPYLDALLADGALSLTTRVSMPSITLPNYTTHLTGSGPEQHGVVNNSWSLTNYQLPPVETDAEGYYPSIFKELKEQVPGIRTAFYANWPKLITPYNPKYFDDAICLDKEGSIEDYEQAFREIVAKNYENAIQFIVAHRSEPTFVFLYSAHTDYFGHKFGWMTPEYIYAIELGDKVIGQVIEQMKKEGLYEETHFLFISDHGGIDKGHGGTTTDEMFVPWGITGPGIKRGYTITGSNNTTNTASTVLHLFGGRQPDCWTGCCPAEIWEF